MPKRMQLGIRLLLPSLFTHQLVSCSAKYVPGLLKILSFFQSLVVILPEVLPDNWNFFPQQLWMDGWLVLVLRSLQIPMLQATYCLNMLSEFTLQNYII